MKSLDKIVENGKVAVIVSPGYGAGWSTWAKNPQSAVFDPNIVRWIQGGKVGPPPIKGDDYDGGLRNAVVTWLPQGTQFRIEEYDGNETLVRYNPDHYYTA